MYQNPSRVIETPILNLQNLVVVKISMCVRMYTFYGLVSSITQLRERELVFFPCFFYEEVQNDTFVGS